MTNSRSYGVVVVARRRPESGLDAFAMLLLLATLVAVMAPHFAW